MAGAGFRLTVRHARWSMVCGAVPSVIWGTLPTFAPGAGAVVATWWLGAYASAVWVLLVGFASRLRGRRGTATAPPWVTMSAI